jgi:hypothetical protein
MSPILYSAGGVNEQVVCSAIKLTIPTTGFFLSESCTSEAMLRRIGMIRARRLQ